MAHRIDTPTADPNANGPGRAGFSHSPPDPATRVDPDFMNSVQELPIRALERFGITPEKGNHEQLADLFDVVLTSLSIGNWRGLYASGSDLHKIASDGAGRVIAVGNNHHAISLYGGALATATGPINSTMSRVRYGNSRWVACAVGFNSLQVSTNNGASWGGASLGAMQLYDLRYGASQSRWVGGNGSNQDLESITATLGATVSHTIIGDGAYRYRVVEYCDDTFIAIASRGSGFDTWISRCSGDPDTFGNWSSVQLATAYTMHAIASDGVSRVVAIGINADDATVRTIVSDDKGATWTASDSFGAGLDTTQTSIAYGNGFFVACGYRTNFGVEVWASRDGLSWTRRATIGRNNIPDICFDGDRFVLCARGQASTDNIFGSLSGRAA